MFFELKYIKNVFSWILFFSLSIFSLVVSGNGVLHHIQCHGYVNGAIKMIANSISNLHTPDSVHGVRIGTVGAQTRALRCPFGLDNTNAGVFTLGQDGGGVWSIVNYTPFGAQHNCIVVYNGRVAAARTAWTAGKRNLYVFSAARDSLTIYD